MKIRSVLTILKIEKRVRIVRGYKNEKGEGMLQHEDTGWWITFPGNFSIHVGNEEPDFKEGDHVVLSITKVTP